MIWDINTVFILLGLFQVKHYIADYPLQGQFMLGKFKASGWALPLAAHCSVHSVMTFGLASRYTSLTLAAMLAILDGGIHFIMDRVKASPNMLGKYKALSAKEYMGIIQDNNLYKEAVKKITEVNKVVAYEWRIKENNKLIASNKYFWWALGFDQLIHHFTDLLVIYIILKGG